MNLPIVIIEAEEAQFNLKTIGTRQVKEQTGYVDLGGKHPKEMKFNLPADQERAYPVGQYVPSITSYRIGKYGNLELNPFELKLEKLIQPADIKKAS